MANLLHHIGRYFASSTPAAVDENTEAAPAIEHEIERVDSIAKPALEKTAQPDQNDYSPLAPEEASPSIAPERVSPNPEMPTHKRVKEVAEEILEPTPKKRKRNPIDGMGGYGGELFHTIGAVTKNVKKKKEEITTYYEEKIALKRNWTELSRLLSNKKEDDKQVTFAEADALREMLIKLSEQSDLNLEGWESFLNGDTTVDPSDLKIMRSQIDYEKKKVSLDLERAAMHLENAARDEKAKFDALRAAMHDHDRVNRAFLRVGQHR
jgi:hypothetical protein